MPVLHEGGVAAGHVADEGHPNLPFQGHHLRGADADGCGEAEGAQRSLNHRLDDFHGAFEPVGPVRNCIKTFNAASELAQVCFDGSKCLLDLFFVSCDDGATAVLQFHGIRQLLGLRRHTDSRLPELHRLEAGAVPAADDHDPGVPHRFLPFLSREPRVHRQVTRLRSFVFADVAKAHDGFDAELFKGGDDGVGEFRACAEWSTDGHKHVRLAASDECGVEEAPYKLRLVTDADVSWVADVVFADGVGRWVVWDDDSGGVFDVAFGEAFARVEEGAEAHGGSDNVGDVDRGEMPAAREAEGVDVAVGDDCVGLQFLDSSSEVVVSVRRLYSAGRFHLEAVFVVVIDGQREQDVDERSGGDYAVGVLVPPYGCG